MEPICDQGLRMIKDHQLTTSHDVDFFAIVVIHTFPHQTADMFYATIIDEPL